VPFPCLLFQTIIDIFFQVLLPSTATPYSLKRFVWGLAMVGASGGTPTFELTNLLMDQLANLSQIGWLKHLNLTVSRTILLSHRRSHSTNDQYPTGPSISIPSYYGNASGTAGEGGQGDYETPSPGTGMVGQDWVPD